VNRPALRIVQEDGTLVAPLLKANSDIQVVTDSEPPLNRLGTEDIYPDPSARSAPLNAALKLLYEAESCLDSAVVLVRDGDLIGADDHTCKFVAMLPELFCCREIGDGFALIVSSMFHAVKNKGSTPLTERQLLGLAFLTKFLRNNIFCAVDTAIDATEKLVTVDLNTDPPALTTVGELLDG
jgi:hypothetical protein